MASSDDFPRRPDTRSFHWASTFQGEDALRTGEWVLSEDPKYDGQASRVRVEPCDLEGGNVFSGDYGLLLDEAHKHYAVGATLSEPLDNAGKDLVMQYEVQVRGGAKCGGAYVKMLRGPAGEKLKALNNESPYSIMFGPDKCFRDTNKVHYIFQHENPNTHEWEEKHFDNAPKIKDDGGFHVYTLHVKKDNTFDLYIDTEVVSSGSLLEDMTPPLVPPLEIDDPEDEQPEDWVTEAEIPDASAVKPDDWDEDAPKKIVDEDAEMPEGWLEDAEKVIPDPSSSKPDDWDDEEDGDWEPIMIMNPACEAAPGCGKWEKPLVANPAYKGKWTAPMIENPDYKGEWHPRKVKNPAHFEIDRTEPSRMAPITGLAVEVWTVDGGVWLDNFVVGDDIAAALKLAEETWRPKFNAFEAIAAEQKKKKELEQANKKKDRDATLPSQMLTASRFLADKTRPYLPASAVPALDSAAENPVAVLATVLAGCLAMLVMMMRRSSSSSNNGKAKPSVPGSSAGDADSSADAAAEDDIPAETISAGGAAAAAATAAANDSQEEDEAAEAAAVRALAGDGGGSSGEGGEDAEQEEEEEDAEEEGGVAEKDGDGSVSEAAATEGESDQTAPISST